MRTTILWTRRARRDVLEIGDFIARDKPRAAARWVGRILDTVERIAHFPTSGRIVPEIDRSDIREVVLGFLKVSRDAVDPVLKIVVICSEWVLNTDRMVWTKKGNKHS